MRFRFEHLDENSSCSDCLCRFLFVSDLKLEVTAYDCFLTVMMQSGQFKVDTGYV